MADDARAVEIAYQGALDVSDRLSSEPVAEFAAPMESKEVQGSQHGDVQMVVPLRKSVRKRDKTHLAFVAAQPCLICQRSPCDAHHLKFAQPRSLGLKVSDEFTVPLCRDHHRDLHRHGNELAWGNNMQVAPIEVAKEFWEMTLRKPDTSIAKGRLREAAIASKP